MSKPGTKAPLILIVDDTQENIRLLGTILRGEGYDLAIAKNGRIAIDQARRLKPDLILLDVMMPEMNGFEACKILKDDSSTKQIPIIFLTALTEISDVAKGFRIGGADYVTKPFNNVELLARVRTHLKLKSQQDAINQRSEELRELLHVLCHDMVVPLGSLLSLVEHLEEYPEDFDICKGDMKSVVSNALKVIELVRRMRSLEEKDFKPIPVCLHRLIKQSTAMVAPRLKEKNLHLNLDLGHGEAWVLAEETSLVNTVLNNLLTNAIKFSYNDRHIDVRVREQGEKVVLTIRDQGVGMPKRLLDDIFDLTKSTNRPGTAGESGTGFGLPLVKKFIDAYGADIQVMSLSESDTPEHGSEFTITFDAAPVGAQV